METKKINPSVIDFCGDNKDGFSVLLGVGKISISVWMDVWVSDSEVKTDWNAYIFDLTNSIDLAKREIQNNPENFSICSDLAIEYLEQNNKIVLKNDKWEYVC